MLKNVGMAERIGRAGLGAILALIGINQEGTAMVILLAAAVVLVLTAAVSYCPIHHTFGISTVGNTIQRNSKSRPVS